VVDFVETRGDVRFQHPSIAAMGIKANRLDRVLAAPAGPKPTACGREIGLKDRFQHQFQRGLYDTVGDSRDPQLAELAARLRDLGAPHGGRNKHAGLQLRP
jgi:hypothetical protein